MWFFCRLQYGILTLCILLLCNYFLQAQDNAIDDFIDDSFIDDTYLGDPNAEAVDETLEIDIESNLESSTEREGSNLNSAKEAETLLIFKLTESFSYKWHRTDSNYNPNALFYQSPWHNTFVVNNFARYKNKEAWLDLQLDYNLFFSLEPSIDSDFSNIFSNAEVANTSLSEFRYELRESKIGLYILNNKLSFSLGKINRSFGSGYLANPSNPMQRTYGFRVQFAKNLKPSSYTSLNLSELTREFGTGDDIGYWASELTLNLYPLVWRIAYLPKLKSGFNEFDRPQHSMLSSLSANYWDSVKPSLLFFLYGQNYFGGVDLSLGIGDYLTLHGEFGLSVENELQIFKESNESLAISQKTYKVYRLEAYADDGLYPSALAGISYTPQIEFRSLATILFEVYYNGKGLWQEEWEEQLMLREEIYATSQDIASSYANTPYAVLASSYEGMLNTGRYHYHPLDARPLYLLLRVSRDDVLSNYWTQKLNLASNIVYSLLDTSFLWEAIIEIETQHLMSFGVNSRYIFGYANGAYTELDELMNLSVYAIMKL